MAKKDRSCEKESRPQQTSGRLSVGDWWVRSKTKCMRKVQRTCPGQILQMLNSQRYPSSRSNRSFLNSVCSTLLFGYGLLWRMKLIAKARGLQPACWLEDGHTLHQYYSPQRTGADVVYFLIQILETTSVSGRRLETNIRSRPFHTLYNEQHKAFGESIRELKDRS